MPVDVDRDRNRGVTHLLLHVRQRFALLNEQTAEGVSQHVHDAAAPAHLRLFHDGE